MGKRALIFLMIFLGIAGTLVWAEPPPQTPEQHLALGEAAYRKGNLEKAAQAWEHALARINLSQKTDDGRGRPRFNLPAPYDGAGD